jgi:serine protease inhibitor
MSFGQVIIQLLRLLPLLEVVLFPWVTWVLYHFDFNNFVSVYLLKNLSKPVQMMALCSSFNFTFLEDLQAKIVGIPYKNNDISMFVLLPNDIDGLEKVNRKPLHLLVYTISYHSVLHPLYPVNLGTRLLNI